MSELKGLKESIKIGKIKTVKDVYDIIKASVASSGKGFAHFVGECNNNEIFQIDFTASQAFIGIDPTLLVLHIFDLMIYSRHILKLINKDFEKFNIMCRVGKDLHNMITDEETLKRCEKNIDNHDIINNVNRKTDRVVKDLIKKSDYTFNKGELK